MSCKDVREGQRHLEDAGGVGLRPLGDLRHAHATVTRYGHAERSRSTVTQQGHAARSRGTVSATPRAPPPPWKPHA